VFAADHFRVASTNWNLQGSAVRGMDIDSSGRLWIGTDKELAVNDGKDLPLFGDKQMRRISASTGSSAIAREGCGSRPTGKYENSKPEDGQPTMVLTPGPKAF
jgi:hypothetical protein